MTTLPNQKDADKAKEEMVHGVSKEMEKKQAEKETVAYFVTAATTKHGDGNVATLARKETVYGPATASHKTRKQPQPTKRPWEKGNRTLYELQRENKMLKMMLFKMASKHSSSSSSSSSSLNGDFSSQQDLRRALLFLKAWVGGLLLNERDDDDEVHAVVASRNDQLHKLLKLAKHLRQQQQQAPHHVLALYLVTALQKCKALTPHIATTLGELAITKPSFRSEKTKATTTGSENHPEHQGDVPLAAVERREADEEWLFWLQTPQLD